MGDGCCLCSVGGAKLAHDVGDMDAGGLLANEECTGDLPVGPALHQVLEDLLLAGSETQGFGKVRACLAGEGRVSEPS